MELFDESKFKTKKELFKFLFENKDSLSAQKMANLKTADCVSFSPTIIRSKEDADKANEPIDVANLSELKVVVIINTTNLMDSHADVHIRGIWKKSLSENKMIMHLQEHRMIFKNIISDGKNLKAYVKDYSWSELGFDFEGKTQALVFESTIEKKRNEEMFNQYANGWVKNHSVGMRYVKYDMAINDEDYPNEFEAWNKYYPDIANKDTADARGYFWYVLEAKAIEGSAVPLGSNFATPTLENNKDEPPKQGTQEEDNQPPKQGTGKTWKEIINENFLKS
jgi:hypothetical protein